MVVGAMRHSPVCLSTGGFFRYCCNGFWERTAHRTTYRLPTSGYAGKLTYNCSMTNLFIFKSINPIKYPLCVSIKVIFNDNIFLNACIAFCLFQYHLSVWNFVCIFTNCLFQSGYFFPDFIVIQKRYHSFKSFCNLYPL